MAHIFGLARVGRDVEARDSATQGGQPWAPVSLAFSFYQKGADNNRGTQWVEAILSGARVIGLAPYLTKGTLVSVMLDDVHLATFQKADGTTGTKMAARVNTIELTPRVAPAAAPAPPPPKPKPPPAAAGSGFEDMDDDIPF